MRKTTTSLIGKNSDNYKSTTSTTGGKLEWELKLDDPTTLLRLFADITTASSTGTGTARVMEMLKSFKVFKGTKDAHERNPNPKAIIEILNYCLPHCATISAILSKITPPVTATGFGFVNTVVAGNATYKAMVDIICQLMPGSYYAVLEFGPATNLTGLSGQTLTLNVAISPQWNGQSFDEELPIKVDTSTISADKSTPPAKNVFLMCASEISTVVTKLEVDGDQSANQIKMTEANAALLAQRSLAVAAAATLPYAYSPVNPTTASTVYYVYAKTFNVPRSMTVSPSTATAFIFATVG